MRRTKHTHRETQKKVVPLKYNFKMNECRQHKLCMFGPFWFTRFDFIGTSIHSVLVFLFPIQLICFNELMSSMCQKTNKQTKNHLAICQFEPSRHPSMPLIYSPWKLGSKCQSSFAKQQKRISDRGCWYCFVAFVSA